MKYIIVEDETGMEIPVVFPEIVNHNRMGTMKIVSAGFCALRDGKFDTWGESKSLGVKNRNEDEEILNRMVRH